MSIKIPNFFIVGAPKAGTTALYEYLRYHPNIFMPLKKEPHYFAKDFPNYPSVKNKYDYLKLFNKSTKEYLAIGEASVWYLYSDVAIKLIKEFNPSAKIIVMLRNPIDLAYAMHGQALYNHNENEPDFEKAWELQSKRQKHIDIPQGCRAHQILQYEKLASLGYQTERLLRIFDYKQVKFIIFEDFINHTQEIYEEVLEFLDVEKDGRTDFPIINESKTHRSKLIGKLTQTPPLWILKIVRYARDHLGIEINYPLTWVRKLNNVSNQRSPLRPEFRNQLVEIFREDIKKLSQLIGKDLHKWLI
ncbi:MAG: sulfotransferase domain-containing protein [Gammaproteobacteria bacterium]